MIRIYALLCIFTASTGVVRAEAISPSELAMYFLQAKERTCSPRSEVPGYLLTWLQEASVEHIERGASGWFFGLEDDLTIFVRRKSVDGLGFTLEVAIEDGRCENFDMHEVQY